MPIYTKKGDTGETSVFAPKEIRISKDSLRIEAIGAVDELNSFLGIVLTFCANKRRVEFVKQIQTNLFAIGSSLAGAQIRFGKSITDSLEKEIDLITERVPKLANFILPGGTLYASHMMYARALSRKAERKIVAYSKQQKVKPEILMYINRLSDMLFTLVREDNFQNGEEETLWIGHKEKFQIKRNN